MSTTETDERSLLAYLLVPRPQDLVKTLVAPVTYLLAAAAVGNLARLDEFVPLWLILEFLIYYARYQCNDVRGRADDRAHPARSLRARLPLGISEEDSRRHVVASLVAATARVIAAVLIGVVLRTVGPVVILIIAVFSAAIVYETLRSGHPERLRRAAGAREVGVWMAVGLGYGIRAGLGLALAVPHLDDMAISLGLVFFWTLGAMYVLLNWALEASNFCACPGDRWSVSEVLRRKPHISALVRHLDGSRAGGPPFTTTPEHISSRTPGYLGASRVLDAHRDIGSPWNIALAFGAALAGLLGAELAALSLPVIKAIIVMICVGGAACLCRSVRSLIRWAIVALVAAVLFAVSIAVDSSTAWAVEFPWLIVSGCYAWFRSLSYIDAMGLTLVGRR